MVSRLDFKAATGFAARLADRFNIFKMYLTHAQFIEYEEGRRRYGLNRLSSNEIEATWGMQLEDPKVPKDVVEGQARIRVGLWTDLFDRDEAIKKEVFKKVRNLGPPIGLAAEGNQALSQDEDEGRLKPSTRIHAAKIAFTPSTRIQPRRVLSYIPPAQREERGAPSQDN